MSILDNLRQNLAFGTAATENMKQLNLITGILYSITPFISYSLILQFQNIYLPVIISICTYLLIFLANLFTLKNLISEFSIRNFIQKVIPPSILTVLLSLLLPILVHFSIDKSWFRLILATLSFTITMSVSTYFITCNKIVRKKY